MIKTECCGFGYIGENHNPNYKGVCRNCGSGLNEVLDKLEAENEKLREALELALRDLEENDQIPE